MRKKSLPLSGWKLLFLPLAAVLFSISANASSHREAPLISADPLADNTDLYAFRSPDDPNTVTIIANYIPFELPEGGPNTISVKTFATKFTLKIKQQQVATISCIVLLSRR